MDSRRRFTEEFRIEAVKQITERGFAVKDVSQRLGVSPYSLYEWIKRYGVPTEDQAARIKKLCNDPPVFAQVRLLISMIDRFVPVFSCLGLDEAGVGCKTQSSH